MFMRIEDQLIERESIVGLSIRSTTNSVTDSRKMFP